MPRRETRNITGIRGTGAVDANAVWRVFECYSPGCDQLMKIKDFDLDHTLPAKHLWPLNTSNATLLCSECNNAKHDKWPSEFYRPEQLKALARLTGIEYDFLSGPPKLNPKAIEAILANVDRFIEQWIAYPDDIKKVRQLIQDMNDIDIFACASTVPDFLKG